MFFMIFVMKRQLDGPDECGETGNLIFDFQARDFYFLKSLEEISLIHISPHNVN